MATNKAPPAKQAEAPLISSFRLRQEGFNFYVVEVVTKAGAVVSEKDVSPPMSRLGALERAKQEVFRGVLK